MNASPKERTRIVFADDHAALRRATAEWMERSGAFEVVAETSTAEEALEAVRSLRPTMVVLDIDMPGQSAFAVAEAIDALGYGTRVVFLSGFFHDRYIEDAIRARAAGYVTKSEPPAKLLEALTRVSEGGTYFSPAVRERILIDEAGIRLAAKPVTPAAALSNREIEVLRHVAKGMSKRQIADLLRLSPRTVERHVSNIMHKVGLHDRVELARYAIREGFVEA